MAKCQKIYVWDTKAPEKNLCVLDGTICPRVGELLSLYEKNTNMVMHCEVRVVNYDAVTENGHGKIVASVGVEIQESYEKNLKKNGK